MKIELDIKKHAYVYHVYHLYQYITKFYQSAAIIH